MQGQIPKNIQINDMRVMSPYVAVTLFNEWHAASTSKKIKAVIEANAKGRQVSHDLRSVRLHERR